MCFWVSVCYSLLKSTLPWSVNSKFDGGVPLPAQLSEKDNTYFLSYQLAENIQRSQGNDSPSPTPQTLWWTDQLGWLLITLPQVLQQNIFFIWYLTDYLIKVFLMTLPKSNCYLSPTWRTYILIQIICIPNYSKKSPARKWGGCAGL